MSMHSSSALLLVVVAFSGFNSASTAGLLKTEELLQLSAVEEIWSGQLFDERHLQ